MTTLRRYIRSGRLLAEMTPGRYGPEYTVTMGALEQAGARERTGPAMGQGSAADQAAHAPGWDAGAGALSVHEASGTPTTALSRSAPRESHPPATRAPLLPESLLREMGTIDLFRELSMKHEQLLVQYGMVRVGGQKLMEHKIEAERLAESLQAAQEEARAERERYAREVGFLKKHLREAELEIETRNQELAEMREKIKMLELLSRNAVTSESIERQFLQVFEKRREVEEISSSATDERRRKMAALDEILKSGFRARPDADPPTDQ